MNTNKSNSICRRVAAISAYGSYSICREVDLVLPRLLCYMKNEKCFLWCLVVISAVIGASRCLRGSDRARGIPTLLISSERPVYFDVVSLSRSQRVDWVFYF